MTTSCGLYRPGHHAHYIPVLKLAPSRPHHQGSVRVERSQILREAQTGAPTSGDAIDGPNAWCLWFTREDGSTYGPFFHHDLPAVTTALGMAGGSAELVEGLWLLRLATPDERSRVVIALSDVPIAPCDPTAYPDQEWASTVD